MAQTESADALTTEQTPAGTGIDPKSFLGTCALSTLVGLTVLAILAQALLTFLAPAA